MTVLGGTTAAPGGAAGTNAWDDAKRTRDVGALRSWGTMVGGGALAGLGVASAMSLLLRGNLRGSFATRALIASGAFAGIAAIGNAVTGGQLGTGAYLSTVGQRHQILWAVRHIGTPTAAFDAKHAYNEARTVQNERWGDAPHIDDGVDALRHAYGAARLVSTMMVERGMSAEQAIELTISAGHAHELDGVDNTAASSRMDEANNRVGARLGADLVARTGGAPGVTELYEAVLAAVADGELQVVEAGDLRASTADDIAEQVE